MKKIDLFDDKNLANQIKLQKEKGWDLELDLNWQKFIQEDRLFVPFEGHQFGFDGVSNEQRIVLSQLFGLIINQTISEMESSLPKLKLVAWEKKLDEYPVNSEMRELGELFFEEEKKHASSFLRFQEKFAHQNEIDPMDLEKLLPKSINSYFLKSILWNSNFGGSSFWWLVASVEEVSVAVFKKMNQERGEIDNLFYELHKRHAEEEIRHENYAYLMLELDLLNRNVLTKNFLNDYDFLFSQVASIPWLITELSKIFRVKKLKEKSEFFRILNTTLPLFEKKSALYHLKNILFQTPYISWFANPKFRHNQKAFLNELKNQKQAAA